MEITIGDKVFETTPTNNTVFHLPTSREERIKKLRIFIFKECQDKWYKESRDIVTMKKQYVTELLDSLL